MDSNQIEEKELIKKLFKDRKRTNVLSVPEQKLLAFFVKRLPPFFTPNVLTFIGLMGSFMVLLGFILAHYIQPYFLFLCVLGLFINWFGDSLDGRIAYFRNIPRKWYGFSLDIIMDWIGTVLIGMGYYFYAPPEYRIVAFVFVVLYGWAMIIAQLRYKITDLYTIDAGLVGPTEIRIILSLVITTEFFFLNSIQYLAGGICVILFIINVVDTNKLLKLGDIRDAAEKKAKENNLP